MLGRSVILLYCPEVWQLLDKAIREGIVAAIEYLLLEMDVFLLEFFYETLVHHFFQLLVLLL